MTRKIRPGGALVVIAAAHWLPVSAATAQETTRANSASDVVQADDIIVTAQKREQNLQQVPVTVQAFGREAIESRGLVQLTDLVAATPGLNIGQTSNGTLITFLRGVGNTANAAGSENSIAVYVDGVYYSRPNAGAFALDDVQRVEVLKGPQGTLFGRNASGGVVHLITQDPSYDPKFRGTVGYGNYQTLTGSAYASVGLTENVAIDFAASGRNQADGFGQNITTGRKTSYTDYYNFKSKLLIEPGDSTKIVISGSYAWSEVQGLGNHFPGTTQAYPFSPTTRVPDYGFYNQRGNVDAYNRLKQYAVSGRLEHETSFANFTSITAYQKVKELYHGEGDYTEQNFSQPTLYVSVKQLSQEFQLSSLAGSPVQWIAGLFYYNNLSAYDRGDFTGYGVPGGGPFDFDTYGRQRSKSYAGYAQVSYPLTAQLSVTGGLRYTEETTKASGRADFRLAASDPLCAVVGGLANGSLCALFPQNSVRKKVSKVTWKGGLDYKLTQSSLLYASVSRSFKSGQFDILFPVPGQTGTDPEVITAYELGLKTDLFDRRLRFNAAVFRYDIDKPQVQLIQNGALVLSNAGSVRIYGAEFDAQARLGEGLVLRASGTWLDSKYRNYANAPFAPPLFGPTFGAGAIQLIDAKGNRPPLTSKVSLGVGGDYTIQTGVGEMQATVDYSYRSKYFFEPSNGPELTQGGYGLLDARLRFSPNEHYSISVWGKNLTDEKIVASAFSLTGTSGFIYVAGAPRTYGATLGVNF